MRASQELEGHHRVAHAVDRNRHTGCVVARSLVGRNLDLELRHNSAVLGSRQIDSGRDNAQVSNLAGLDEKPLVDSGHKEYIHPAAHRDKLVYRVTVMGTVPADHVMDIGRILPSVAEADTMDSAVHKKEYERLRYYMEHLAGQRTMVGGVAALPCAPVGQSCRKKKSSFAHTVHLEKYCRKKNLEKAVRM